MNLTGLFTVFSDVFYNIGLIGTIITVFLFIISVIFKSSAVNKLVVVLGRMFVVIWVLQIGICTYLLITNGSNKATASNFTKVMVAKSKYNNTDTLRVNNRNNLYI